MDWTRVTPIKIWMFHTQYSNKRPIAMSLQVHSLLLRLLSTLSINQDKTCLSKIPHRHRTHLVHRQQKAWVHLIHAKAQILWDLQNILKAATLSKDAVRIWANHPSTVSDPRHLHCHQTIHLGQILLRAMQTTHLVKRLLKNMKTSESAWRKVKMEWEIHKGGCLKNRIKKMKSFSTIDQKNKLSGKRHQKYQDSFHWSVD